METVINESELIILVNNEEEFRPLFELVNPDDVKKAEMLKNKEIEMKNKIVIDLVRIAKQVNLEGKYDGICW
jgi:hypothetical protein